jgi:hypothetical protein
LEGQVPLTFLVLHCVQVVEFLVGDSLNRIKMFERLNIDVRTRVADLIWPCKFPSGGEIFSALDVGTRSRLFGGHEHFRKKVLCV